MHDAESITNALRALGVHAIDGAELRDYTTFRIGGPAEIVAEVRTPNQMADALGVCGEHDAPALCLGGGSNVLVSDGGVSGVVLLNRIEHVRTADNTIVAGGGASWDALVVAAATKGLAGVVAMSGIPGSVGGAIYGNAGAYGECVGDVVDSITTADRDGHMRRFDASRIGFAYRSSSLANTDQVVVEATFNLDTGEPEALAEQRESILATRAAKLPTEDDPTAGSFFRNIDDPDESVRIREALGLLNDGRRIAAGLLLDRVGAREMSVGDARVFERHANIIVNRGSARASDVLELAHAMHVRVKDRFGIELRPEVRWIGVPGEDMIAMTEKR